jgi:hypothetical protein
MRLCCDDHKRGSTVAIIGRQAELLELAKSLCDYMSISIAGDTTPDQFYKRVLANLVFVPLTEKQPDALITISLEGNRLRLSCGVNAALRLGQSLQNFFGGSVQNGQHFHLDYFEGDLLLAPTENGLIFQCET